MRRRECDANNANINKREQKSSCGVRLSLAIAALLFALRYCINNFYCHRRCRSLVYFQYLRSGRKKQRHVADLIEFRRLARAGNEIKPFAVSCSTSYRSRARSSPDARWLEKIKQRNPPPAGRAKCLQPACHARPAGCITLFSAGARCFLSRCQAR